MSEYSREKINEPDLMKWLRGKVECQRKKRIGKGVKNHLFEVEDGSKGEIPCTKISNKFKRNL